MAYLQTNAVASEPDAIKLFIGMVPKHLDENAIRPYFEPFGEIHDLNVLRDRMTGLSKGCAFLTFRYRQSAIECMQALHEKHVIPESTHPLTVKPAGTEGPKAVTPNAEDRKLFVGMLSFTTTEDYLRGLFSRFGTIDECTILRGQDGSSKGCGFIKFSSRVEALAAIDALHEKMTLEGSRGAMQVRFADNEQERAQRRVQQMGSQGFQQPMMMMQQPQITAQAILAAAPLLSLLGINPAMIPQFQQAQFGGTQFDQQQQQYNQAQYAQPTVNAALSGVQQFTSGGYAEQPYAQQSVYGAATTRTPRGSGPDGANLFILNLPADAVDDTLRVLFSPFGNVISATVYHDKVTRISKQFGFVSYDNPSSAAIAISSMNGYNLNGYVLKVSLKKQTTPY